MSLFLLPLVACSGSTDREQHYLQRALEHFEAGTLGKARVDVRNVLQINERNSEARLLYGRILKLEQNWKEAYRNFNLAVEFDPMLVPARIELGTMLLSGNRLQEALENAEAALDVDGLNAHALALKAAVHHRMGEVDQALSVAQQSLRSEPGNPSAVAVLTRIYQADQPELALDVLNEGIRVQPQSAVIKLMRISVFEEQGDVGAAIPAFEELAREHPENPYILYRYISFLQKSGEVARAETLLRDFVRRAPEAVELKLWLAQFLVNERSLEAAEQSLLQFIAEDGDQLDLRFALGQVYILQQRLEDARALFRALGAQQDGSAAAQRARNALVRLELAAGNLAQAEAVFDEIFSLEPENSEALVTRAQLSISAGKLEDAVTDLRTVVRNQAEPVEALLLLGQAHTLAGNTSLAVDLYRRVLSFAPDNERAMLALITHAINSGELSRAAEMAASAMRVNPGSSEAARLLVSAYAGMEAWEKAADEARRLTEFERTRVLGTYLLGRVAYARGDLAAAERHLSDTLELNPLVVEALQVLAELHLRRGDQAAAYELVEAHIRAHPDDGHALRLLGQMQAAHDDAQSAAASYEQALAARPSSTRTHILLGDLYLRQGEAAAAEAVYEKGLGAQARNVDLLVRMGHVSQQLQRYEKAARYYETALTLRPLAAVQNNLAMLYADHLQSEANFAKALSLMRTQATSRVPAFLDTLGWVNYRLGNAEEALRYLESAAAALPDEPGVQYHLGMAYLLNGQADEARVRLGRALEGDRKFVGAEDALVTLERLERDRVER